MDWFRIAPSRFSHVIFATGPVGPDLAVAPLVERFSGCRLIGLNVLLVGNLSWQPFDLLMQRDGAGRDRPDLAWAAPIADPPVVARVQIHRQVEYAGARPEAAHAAFDRLLAGRPAASFVVDTVLDANIPGRRTAPEVEALIARADVVLTTRLHGLVLALRRGVPAVAIDPIPGGAKVTAQARCLEWPASVAIDHVDDALLASHFEWGLTPSARSRAQWCGRRAAAIVEDVRIRLERELGVSRRRRGNAATTR